MCTIKSLRIQILCSTSIFPAIIFIVFIIFFLFWKILNTKSKIFFLRHCSVFLLLRRLITKLSTEVGCGEVTNPKQPVRERDRQSPTALNVTTCACLLRLGEQCYVIVTQQFAERSELGKFLARMNNLRRHRQVGFIA